MKAVIWDMDGVLIDSEPIYYKIYQEIFKRINITVSFEEFTKYMGLNDSKIWEIIKGKNNLTQSVAWLLQLQKDAERYYFQNNDLEPINGVVPLLNELLANGIRIGLASSSTIEHIELITSKLNISDHFIIKMSGDMVKKGKPEPDIFIEAANRLAVVPSHCVVIEDTENGLKAAKNGNMKCVGFQNKNSGNQDLSGADLIVDSLTDLNVNILSDLLKR